MELTAFKNTPEELIRHIMGYARPTYYYMNELNESLKHTRYIFERWDKYEHPLTPKQRVFNQMLGETELDEGEDTLLSISEVYLNWELNRVELPNGESKELWYIPREE